MDKIARLALLTYIVKTLNKKWSPTQHSWPARIHIQKSVFFAQLACNVPFSFEFHIHQYGPYAAELDVAIAELQAINAVGMEPIPPYGPRYFPGSSADVLLKYGNKLIKSYESALNTVCDLVIQKQSRQLELISTIAYIDEHLPGENETTKDELVRRLKPHFSKLDIKTAREEWQQWRSAFRSRAVSA
ncbi:MAG: hypothetical protein HYX80_09930 [Chloroflexi bacterium]|nr:hypothetical protein [Chloroflexota bacterium]